MWRWVSRKGPLVLLWPVSLATQETARDVPRLTLGVLDGPVELSFGYIEDLQLDSAGNIFVLDRYVAAIPWFDANGTFRANIGRKGQGPGEFVEPIALTVDRENRIHVVDAANARFSVFEVGAGQVVPLGEQRLTVPVSDVCFVGARRFVLARGQRAMMLEIDTAGQVLREFPEPTRLDSRLEQEIGSLPHSLLEVGPIVCDAQRSIIYHASGYLGVVRAYTAEGSLLWSVKVPDFHQADIQRGSYGLCCRYGQNPETKTVDQIIMAAVDEQGRLHLTVYEAGPGISPSERYETRILRHTDGLQISDSPADYAIAGYYGGRPYGYTNFPVPRVIVY
jgi:hypothetical protein